MEVETQVTTLFMHNHERFLLRCIELAEQRSGFCAPNPAVGCVIVKDDKIIAEGFHFGCGYAHAEVDALNKTGDAVRGATLYVSLEPCCHFGKTPPCTEKIKSSGIKTVYFGLKDPNPLVSGKGQAALIEAGISCAQIDIPEINKFYQAYAHWTKTKKPFVTAKLAMSADFKIAGEHKKPVKISGIEADFLTHQYRKKTDAILTTIETILNDDPQLNARIKNTAISKKIYILDSRARLPLTAKILKTAEKITVFYSEDSDCTHLENKNVRCIKVSKNNFGLNLNAVLEKIGADGVHDLWVEAGAQCFKIGRAHV